MYATYIIIQFLDLWKFLPSKNDDFEQNILFE